MADLLSPISAPESRGFPEIRGESVAPIASPGSSVCNTHLVPAWHAHMYTPMHVEVCIYMPSCARSHTWVCELLTQCMCSNIAQVHVCPYPHPDQPSCECSHGLPHRTANKEYTFLLGLHGYMSWDDTEQTRRQHPPPLSTPLPTAEV